MMIISLFFSIVLIYAANAYVLREGDRTYIVDRTGEKWDVTQAKAIGFEPRHFRFGLGRHAFTPLGESDWQEGQDSGASNLRVIGVSNGKGAHAYSVPKLSRHETANTILGNDSIAATY
jgi:hypothetical protein